MSTDDYYACLGKTFARRKAAVRELQDREQQAKRLGEVFTAIAQELSHPERITAPASAAPAPDDTPLYPPSDDIVALIQQIRALRQEIQELDAVLS